MVGLIGRSMVQNNNNIQRSEKWLVRGWVKFVPALDLLFCLLNKIYQPFFTFLCRHDTDLVFWLGPMHEMRKKNSFGADVDNWTADLATGKGCESFLFRSEGNVRYYSTNDLHFLFRRPNTTV